MAKNGIALATIAIALTACQTTNAELINSIAEQCGIDATSAHSIAAEVQAAHRAFLSDVKL